MTERLYYSDSYTTQFDADVTAAFLYEQQPAVLLAKTYFYPSSGGQPCDNGQIGEARVVDVVVREADRAVVHLLDQPLPVGHYAATIAWQRRFDHMQQHTGQHILSRAFIELADATTVGFHLGLESVTIDLDQATISAENLQAAEQLANEIIWQNRPILTTHVSKAAAAALPLRKRPTVAGDTLRIVEIEGFDLNACGGTHVQRTGEVGMIKIVNVERVRKQVRVGFRCGQRALIDYDQKNRVMGQLSAEFSCATADVPAAVQRLRNDFKQMRKQAKTQGKALINYEATKFLENALPLGKEKLIIMAFSGRNPNEVRQLVNHLTRNAGTIILMGVAGTNAQLIFGRSKDAAGTMNQLLKIALAPFNATGGGSEHHAQGGGFSADLQTIETILQEAKTNLIDTI